MYAALAHAVLDDADGDRMAERVAHLRRRYPRASRDALARRLIRRAALQCAAGSAMWTGPAAFFGAAPFGAGLAYQVGALNRLVLALAALYGHRPSGRERTAGIAAGMAASVGAEVLRQGTVRVLRRLLPRRPAARGASGAVVGAVLGYGAAMAIGGLAREVFRGGRRSPRWARR